MKEIQNQINELKSDIELLKENKTCISLREHQELIDGLYVYKKIKELKPIAEMMERQINKLIIWA